MTVEGLLASLVWSGVASYAVWRADTFATRFVAAKHQAFANANTTPTSRLVTPNRAQIELPDDLNALAMEESESWAQDDTRALIRDKFLELGDWQKVRRVMGIGELP
jgi:hypothetical protein